MATVRARSKRKLRAEVLAVCCLLAFSVFKSQTFLHGATPSSFDSLQLRARPVGKSSLEALTLTGVTMELLSSPLPAEAVGKREGLLSSSGVSSFEFIFCFAGLVVLSAFLLFGNRDDYQGS
eukprot:TRINITY_DN16545_c2_g4_i1.p1 TRINITY_DN16545_c2_g4~~TRINITY_DN16545_c2_g4_i1.p1  ORF type:complete len:122 (+),score=21.19 TRINITY_DN16545_c2_g4_i1:80-445(+)